MRLADNRIVGLDVTGDTYGQAGGSQKERLQRMAEGLPLGTDAESVRRRIDAMEQLLERSITLPGINRKIGLDAIVGLIPIGGDVLTAGMGLYMVWEARNLGMPKWRLLQMMANIGVDTAVGAIPLAGDVLDFFYRSNSKNLRIIKRHLDKHHPATRVIDG